MASVSCQVYAVPIYAALTRRSVESVGGVFDPIVGSTSCVHVNDELAVIPCLLLANL